MGDLEELVLYLTTHGRPKLFNMDAGGWYCYVEMHVVAVGSSFKIASDFDHATPTEAVRTCIERLNAMRSQFAAPQLAIGDV